MRILITDDETPARSELRYILETLIPEATFYETAGGKEALDLIEREPIDVVFLDIAMPGMDGLTVAATIIDGPEPPLIVFATAYNEHALQAFELAALDYVVKPFNEKRLAQTIKRLNQALSERDLLAQKQTSLRQYLQQTAPGGGLNKLWGEHENKNRSLVDYQDILYLEAIDKKVYMQTQTGDKLLVHYTLKELEPRLSEHNFARVHKGYVVNLDYLAEVVPWFSGSYLIRLTDSAATEIPMSRRYAAQLKKITDWR